MSLSVDRIEAAAPDQISLKAAPRLTKAAT